MGVGEGDGLGVIVASGVDVGCTGDWVGGGVGEEDDIGLEVEQPAIITSSNK